MLLPVAVLSDPGIHWIDSRPAPAPWAWRGLGLVTTADPLQTIAATIQKVEGYYPGSLAYRNNNPGNLVYAGQPGATADGSGYAVFPTYQAGLNALYNQINLYASRGMTITDMMAVYCPSSVSGCDPATYAQTIAQAVGVTPDALVSDTLAGDVSGANVTVPDTSTGDTTVNPDGSVSMGGSIGGMDLSTTTLVLGGLVLLTAAFFAFR